VNAATRVGVAALPVLCACVLGIDGATAHAGTVSPDPVQTCPQARTVVSQGAVTILDPHVRMHGTQSHASYGFLSLAPPFVGNIELGVPADGVIGAAGPANAPAIGLIGGSYVTPSGTCVVLPAIVIQP
jgi:hypothetical protein